MSDVFLPVVPDKKHPLRCAVYDRYMRRSPMETKRQSYAKIACEFNISIATVQRYIRKAECGTFLAVPNKQGRSVYAWDAEALSFFTNFYLAALSEVGGCTVRNAYNYTLKEAGRRGWRIGSEQSAYVHARNISPAMIMLAKGGVRALDNMFYISRDLSKLNPFQLIVGDQHRFDFWCLDDDGKTYIRAECYLWLDMATRLVYGISFDKHYNSRTVTRALRMGIRRFGKFDSTYNDNGSSEKSDLADYIVASLQSYGVRFVDEADLYRSDNGRYVVEDTEGCVVDVVKTKTEWHKQHRRIFARVKNAKTKPIERFFSTLEQLLRDMCLPGYVKELGLSAPEEEQADKRLKWQRKNGYILTYDEFIAKVLQAIEKYETRGHASIGCSPRDCLNKYKADGWIPTYIDPRDESYLFMESARVIVRGDRVRLADRDYIGPDLTQEMLTKNRGTLVAYNRQKIELRYDPENLDAGVFAIEPGTNNAIFLRPVEKIDMFDGDSAAKQLAWKNRNIAAVKEAFDRSVKDKGFKILSDPEVFDPLREAEELAQSALCVEYKKGNISAEKTLRPQANYPEQERACVVMRRDEMSEDDFIAGVASRISSENVLRSHGKPVFFTERERYDNLLQRFVDGKVLSRDDVDFKIKYEQKMTPQERVYAQAFVKQNQ